MTYRIKEIRILENFVVSVIFQDGVEKEYDVKTLFEKYPQFAAFKTTPQLFSMAKIEVGGCAIVWNDELDLAAGEIWANGIETGQVHKVDIFSELGAKLTKAREREGITQNELAQKVNIYQGDISKIERGTANPSVRTLQRLAEGMGMRLKIEFERCRNE